MDQVIGRAERVGPELAAFGAGHMDIVLQNEVDDPHEARAA
jgi:hypothetical protein